ncbi:hypothetical protein UFOVP460_19 [uncultured Caudovirales phage]|uniref:Uncharacterized protein n=1 Tax=uncultured Caudovirales phage TaxID=2100421 RepID=A0A6J5MCY9_9CAUD|nr:hypothetical protein UFOVP460_19 [uncultured Caudovirales phage]
MKKPKKPTKHKSESEAFKQDAKLKDFLMEMTDEVVIADGLSDAFVGLAQTGSEGKTVAVYDSVKIIGILMEQGMTQDEAVEYYEYNILGAYVGDATPIYLVPVDKECWSFKLPDDLPRKKKK